VDGSGIVTVATAVDDSATGCALEVCDEQKSMKDSRTGSILDPVGSPLSCKQTLQTDKSCWNAELGSQSEADLPTF
jgi:hypothetical protein